MTTDSIISKVWSFCPTLRDDGVGYGARLIEIVGDVTWTTLESALVCEIRG